jgi:hypothetical protein
MGTGHRSDWSKCGHAGDDHMGDARRIAPRLIERGPVGDRGGIEDRNVGGEARPQRAAVDEPHRSGAAAQRRSGAKGCPSSGLNNERAILIAI